MNRPLPLKMHKALQIGTARAAFQFGDDLPPALRGAVGTDAPAEEALWLALGALDLWTRAGCRPVTDPAALPGACAAESLRPSPPRAQTVFSLLLQDSHVHLRAEWLRMMQDRGCHAPSHLLAALLELGTAQAGLRARIVPVLGERGAWLAAQNPDWSWALPGPDDAHMAQAWETGDIAQRSRALRQMRLADPGAALHALSAVWALEPAEHRASLLACLEAGLGGADEAFLEAALDDRRKEVRMLAQGLLARIPGSQLAERMIARLTPLLRLERRVLGAARLEVTVPAERDKAMLRDGVGQGSYPGEGEKAGWLVDMLAVIPPSHWSDSFKLSPRDCLKLAASTDFSTALLRGWSRAVEPGLDACAPGSARAAALGEWFAALTELLPGSGHYPGQFFAAFARLREADADALLRRLIGALGPALGDAGPPLLARLQELAAASTRHWPPQESRALVRQIQRGLAQCPPGQWMLRAALPVFAGVIDPTELASYEQGWPASGPVWDAWEEPVTNFLGILRFRNEMYQSFQEHAS